MVNQFAIFHLLDLSLKNRTPIKMAEMLFIWLQIINPRVIIVSNNLLHVGVVIITMEQIVYIQYCSKDLF